ncbi:MAG: F0F1 ATP synthase subunit B [Rubrobacteraceae bacterium]
MGDSLIFDLPRVSLIFWEIVAFSILIALLYWFVFPPIQERIQRRQSQIEQAIDEAEKTRREARELLADYRKQLDEARGEARRILDESRRQGESQRERVRSEAREEGDRIIQQARDEIGRERDTALREVRGEVASMVIEASERVLGREVDHEEHERLISEALDNLEAEVTGGVSRDGRGDA